MFYNRTIEKEISFSVNGFELLDYIKKRGCVVLTHPQETQL